MNITHRHDRTLPNALLQFLIQPFGHLISKPGKPLPAGSPHLKPHSSAARKCNITERRVEDIWIYDLVAKFPHRDTSVGNGHSAKRTRRVYYIAGGSFCMLPSPDHWRFLAALSTEIPHSVISIISAPLAPHSPAPVTFPHLVRLYKSLMTARSDVSREGEETVSFMGDSSGGNLVLAVVLSALSEDPGLSTMRAPDNLLLVTPVVDLRLCNSDIAEVEKKDPVLRRAIEVATAKSWAGSWDLSDGRLSPLLADISILREREVKVHGVVGGFDLLAPDTISFLERCRDGGVKGEWLRWEKQIHCFPLAFSYRLPESVKGKEWIVDVLRRNA